MPNLITIPSVARPCIIALFAKLFISYESYQYSNSGMKAAHEKNAKERTFRRHRLKVMVRCTIYRLLVLAAIFLAIFFVTETLVSVLLASYSEYAVYFYLVEIALAGYFVIRTISQLVYGLIGESSASQARSARGVIVIAGYLLMVAIAISVLAQNPTVTVIIGTVTGIVLGVSMQSLIGNAVAGLVLSLTRPFKIGDRITVFGNSGEVFDIGLLYTTLITHDGDTVLAPNASLLTTPVVRTRRDSRTRERESAGSSAV
jgi:small-conductance mechanosensitive channel